MITLKPGVAVANDLNHASLTHYKVDFTTSDDLVLSPIHEPHDFGVTQLQAWLWRGFDVIVALLITIAIFPVIIAISIAVFVDDPGPIVFRHRRIGRDGRYFHCLKFRTMKVHTAEGFQEHLRRHPELLREWTETFKLRNDPRITRVGRLLRKSSLDELPQLLNVLRGDMSLVGPRPIVDDEVERYGDHFASYCSVRPGLTGLWQVSGRSNLCYKERVALDCEYITRKSIFFDSLLIIKTVPAVMILKGAY